MEKKKKKNSPQHDVPDKMYHYLKVSYIFLGCNRFENIFIFEFVYDIFHTLCSFRFASVLSSRDNLEESLTQTFLKYPTT